jgi:hypothetical protein
VESDPLTKLSESDRAARQKTLLDIYNLQKSLVPARNAVRKLRENVEAVQKQLDSNSKSSLDKLLAHITEVQRSLDTQFTTIGNISRAIDGFTGLPTAGQLRQVEWAYEDSTKGIEELNQISAREVPAAFNELTAQKIFPPVPQPVASPRRP